MKPKYIALLFVFVSIFSMLVVRPVWAQDGEPPPEGEPIELANLFTWALSETPNWGLGALYAGLGLVGALVTVFGLVGGAIPGTTGFAHIDAGLKRVEEREKRLDQLINDSNSDPKRIESIEKATNNLRDDLEQSRRKQFTLAAILYVVLGAFFAAMLARDLLQAILIGAGWTAYLGALGLKKDYNERKALKDDATQKLENVLNEAKEKLEAFKGSESWRDEWGLYDPFANYDELDADVRVAKAL